MQCNMLTTVTDCA